MFGCVWSLVVSLLGVKPVICCQDSILLVVVRPCLGYSTSATFVGVVVHVRGATAAGGCLWWVRLGNLQVHWLELDPFRVCAQA